jgi:capsular polysaccharide transport system permease protein
VTGMELMRYGIWGGKITPYYDIPYAIAVSLGMTVIGLVLCRRIRRILIVE